MSNSSKHVIIIGAGIAGVSVAYYLSKAGIDVTVLDKGDGTDNCSYGNAGMIVPSHIIPLASPGIISKGLRWMLNAESPFYIRPRLNKDLFEWGWKFKKASTQKHVEESAPLLKKMLLKSRSLLIDLEQEEGLDFDFQKRGLFMLCNSEKGLEEEAEVVERANELDIPAEILTAEEVRKREPGLDMDIIGAAYFPKDAHLHPGSLMDGLKKLLSKRGVRFEYSTGVKGLTRKGRRATGVITTEGRTFEGTEVVLCTGAQTPSLSRKIGIRMPMQAGKGYSITLNNPDKIPQNCAIFSEAKVTMTPMNGVLRFAGTMEITGTDTRINPKKISGLKKSVCRYLPSYTIDELDVDDIWVGLRPISPDGLPYVGAFESYENVYASTGQAMMGMSLGPASGKIVSDLITKGEADITHRLIDPNRYN